MPEGGSGADTGGADPSPNEGGGKIGLVMGGIRLFEPEAKLLLGL